MYRQASVHFEEHGEKYASGCVVIVLAIIISFSLVYIVAGNSFNGIYTGTLIQAKVLTVKSCNKYGCNYDYYLDEIFTKGNSTNTCIVQRFGDYSSFDDANKAVTNTILGTVRRIYQTYNDAGICIDDSIRNYNNEVGWTLFGIAMFIILCLVLVIFNAEMKKMCGRPRNNNYYSENRVYSSGIQL